MWREDVLDIRNKLIAKLDEQGEVEKVGKVFVNKNDAFTDEHNLKWHSVDVNPEIETKLIPLERRWLQ